MSIHTWKSYEIARGKRAMAARSKERWQFLTDMSKRELAELVCHLASVTTESYDETIMDDELLFARVNEELEALRGQGIL